MKYNYLIIMFVMIMLVSTVSALDFDNIKEYNEDSQTITITNAFGLGERLARIQLMTPLHNKVGYGSNVQVALLKIHEYTKVDGALEGIATYSYNDMLPINKEINMKYKENYEVEVADGYCNRFGIGECLEWIENGTKVIEKIRWVSFSDVTELPDKNNIFIGLYADTTQGERVEWIPDTWFGERIEEWANWDASLDTDLQHYYAFEETSGAVVDSIENVNGTTNGNADLNVDGILGSGIHFDGSGDYVDLGQDLNVEGEDEVTISLWSFINDSVDERRTIFASGNGINHDCDMIRLMYWDNDAGDFMTRYRSQSTHLANNKVFSATAGITDDTWQHFVFSMDDARAYFWVDGDLKYNVTRNNTGVLPDLTCDISIGRYGSYNGYYHKGYVDEIGIWNRSLTDAEVTTLYGGGTPPMYGDLATAGDAAPSVTLNSPASGANLTNNTVVFNCSATDDYRLENITFYIDDVVNETNNLIDDAETSYTGSLGNSPANAYDEDWTTKGTCKQANGACDLYENITTNFVDPFILSRYNVATSASYVKFWNYSSGAWENAINPTVASATNYTFYIGANGVNDSLVRIWHDIDSSGGTVELYETAVIAGTNATATFTKTFEWGSSHNWTCEATDNNTNNTIETALPFNILNITLDNCSGSSGTILNLTLKNEESQALINGTIEVDVDLYNIETGELIQNYSAIHTDVNNALVCIDAAILAANNYTIDSVIRYESTGFASEFYNIQNETVTGSTTPFNITLYDLNSSDTTEFLITFKDGSFIAVPDALIEITRKYIGEGIFKTVEIPITDSLGQAVGHFDTDSVIYTIIVKRYGDILATFDNVVVKCEDSTIGDCKINLNAESDVSSFIDWRRKGGIMYSMDFDESARDVTVSFTSVGGTSRTVEITSVKNDQFGNETVCNDTITSSSGSLTCSIPASYGNVSVVAELIADNELVTTGFYSINSDPKDFMGYDGTIITIILFMTLPLLVISNVIIMLIMGIVGLVLASLLLVFEGGSIFGIGSILIWLIVAIGIIIWKINKLL